jgi:hypothetical protein
MSDIRDIIGDLLEKAYLTWFEEMIIILQKKFREKKYIGSLLEEKPEQTVTVVLKIPLKKLIPREEREVEVGWSRPHLYDTKEVQWNPTLGL